MAASNIKTGRPLLLIEIGNEWVKMLEITSGRHGIAVNRLFLERFETIGSAVSTRIAEVIKEKKFIKSPLIACLPRHLVNVRVVELPSVKPEEIKDMLHLQLGKHTPYSKEEICFDYRNLVPSRDGYSRLMLVMVQRSILSERYYILEEAGLRIDRMSVSSEGLLNWYIRKQGNKEEGTEIIVDIDSGYSDFAVVSGAQLLFTRSILVGADHLSSDFNKWNEKLMHEIAQSIETCRTENNGIEPARIIITGAGRQFSGLADALSSGLNISTEVIDTTKDFAKLPDSPSLGDMKFAGISLTSLAGMAMLPEQMEVHLVPDSVKLRQELIGITRSIGALGIAIMILFMGLSFGILSKTLTERQQLLLLKKGNAELEPKVQKVTEMFSVIRAVEQRRKPDETAINMLAVLHPLVPSGVLLEKVEIHADEGRLVAGGTASSRQDIREVINALESSALFSGVKETEASRRLEDGRFKFQITAMLEGGK